MKHGDAQLVSIILVNYNGIDDTLSAIESILESDWPPQLIEIVVVDNASQDESISKLKGLGEDITLVESKINLGFAAGCNLGVSRSSGAIVAFLNNDAKPHRQWIRAAANQFNNSVTTAAVASKVLDWEGKTVDYSGAALTWYGMGYKPGVGQPPSRKQEFAKEVLFGTGAAMFVRRSVFDELNGFDDSYFMFFEDVDFGWRLNLAGYKFVYLPQSIAYHKHHSSMNKLGRYRESYLLERNSLFTLYKNLSDERLAVVLPAAMGLIARRSVVRGGVNPTSFELTNTSGDSEDSELVPKITIGGLYAIDQFVSALPHLVDQRKIIQATRRASESRIAGLLGNIDAPIIKEKYFLEGYENLIAAFDVLSEPSSRKLLVLEDPVDRLGGLVPEVSARECAEALAKHFDVTLVVASEESSRSEAISSNGIVCSDDRRAMREAASQADITVIFGSPPENFESRNYASKFFVMIPSVPDLAIQTNGVGGLRLLSPNMVNALMRADRFIVTSAKQMELLTKALQHIGRLQSSGLGGTTPDELFIWPERLATAPLSVLPVLLSGDTDSRGGRQEKDLHQFSELELITRALADYALDPKQATDAEKWASATVVPLTKVRLKPYGLRHNLASAVYSLRAEGIVSVVKQILARLGSRA